MIKKVLSATLILALLVAIIAALCWRAMLSVEITDEMHGIASVLAIIQGQKPLYTYWFQTGWCLPTPFYSLFIALNNGGREGIVLFSRLLYVVFTIVLVGFITLKIAKKNKNASYLALLGCISYVPFSMFQLGYNHLTVYILFLAAYCIDAIWKKKNDFYLWIIPGILFGLACISYATLPVMTIITALCILFFNKNNNGIKKTAWFSLGVIIVGSTFIAWILSEASLNQILKVVDAMRHSPHEIGKGPFWWFAINAFVGPFISPKRLLVVLFFVGASLIAQWKVKKYSHFTIYVILNVLNCLLLLYQPINDLFAFIFWMLTISWMFFEQNIKIQRYSIYLFIQLGFSLTYALTSDNTNCLIGFAITAMMTAFIAIDALIGLFGLSKKQFSAAIIALTVIATPGLLNVYRYVYRDESVFELNTKVEHGIYKGLFTTNDRKDFVLKMEDIISSNTDSSDTLCVVVTDPMLYVMSDAKITSPHTWGPMFFARGFTSAEPILSYFRLLHIPYPNIMAATNGRTKDFFDTDKYEIKQFIKENYNLFFFEEITVTKLALWRKKAEQ